MVIYLIPHVDLGTDAFDQEGVITSYSIHYTKLYEVERLEKGDAKDLIIERSRNAISEALMEVVKG